MKAAIKRDLAAHRTDILMQLRGTTQKAHQESFLVPATDVCMEEVVTSALCPACFGHAVRFHAKAITCEDMHVGQ